MKSKPQTLGELKTSGFSVLSIKEEMRNNIIRMLENNEQLFPGIIGYDRL